MNILTSVIHQKISHKIKILLIHDINFIEQLSFN